jgi:hypothetical protein
MKMAASALARLSKEDPNLSKPSQARPSLDQDNQRKKLGFPWILLSESSLFKGLR